MVLETSFSAVEFERWRFKFNSFWSLALRPTQNTLKSKHSQSIPRPLCSGRTDRQTDVRLKYFTVIIPVVSIISVGATLRQTISPGQVESVLSSVDAKNLSLSPIHLQPTAAKRVTHFPIASNTVPTPSLSS